MTTEEEHILITKYLEHLMRTGEIIQCSFDTRQVLVKHDFAQVTEYNRSEFLKMIPIVCNKPLNVKVEKEIEIFNPIEALYD